MASAIPLSSEEIADMRKMHIQLTDNLEALYNGPTKPSRFGRAVQSIRAACGTKFISAQHAARSGAQPAFTTRALWAQYDAAKTEKEKAEALDKLRTLHPTLLNMQQQLANVAKAKREVGKKLFQAYDNRSYKEQIAAQNTREMNITPDGFRIAGLGGNLSARQQWYHDLHERIEPLGLMSFIALLMEMLGSGNNPDTILLKELCKARDALNAAEDPVKGGQGRRFDVILEADGDFTLICRDKNGKNVMPSKEERTNIIAKINHGLAEAAKGNSWYQGLSVEQGAATSSSATFAPAASATAPVLPNPPLPPATAPDLGPATPVGGGRAHADSIGSVDSIRTADPTLEH